MNPNEPPSGQPPTFEAALGELEQCVRQLEEGELGLSEALAVYEQGVRRLRQCHHLLRNAERKIELLARLEDDEVAVTEPFDAAATDEQLESTGRRRSRKKRPPGPKAGDDVDGQKGLF